MLTGYDQLQLRYDDGDPTGRLGPGTLSERHAVARNALLERFYRGEISADHYRTRKAAIDAATIRDARDEYRNRRFTPRPQPAEEPF